MLQPKESKVVFYLRYKSRKLKVKSRINNNVIACNKVKTFEIPTEVYQNLLIL